MNYIVTGPICSGKSTLLDIAKKFGFNILKSDDLVTALYEDENIKYQLSEIFKIKIPDAGIKETIRKLFFKSQSNRMIIENILHPIVHSQIEYELRSNKNIFIELPPIKSNTLFIKNNKSIYIECDINIRKKRYKNRHCEDDALSFNKINEYQSDSLLIRTYCDIIIINEYKEDSFNEYFEKDIIKS